MSGQGRVLVKKVSEYDMSCKSWAWVGVVQYEFVMVSEA